MSAAPRSAAIALIADRRPKRMGNTCALTELQQVELVAWYKARCAIGTWKMKARELGVSEPALKAIVDRRLGLNGR